MWARLLPFLLASAVAAVDQLIKGAIVARFPLGYSTPLIPGILYLSRVHNTGSAFGLFGGRNPLLAAIAGAIALGVGWLIWRGKLAGGPERLGGSLVLGGALGNLIDRLARGYVVDYLDFRVFPAFNLADAAVVVGAAALAVGMLRRRE